MAKKKLEEITLQDVDELGKKLPGWELAALKRAVGWADGKQVSPEDFDTVLNKFRGRATGSGKI